MDILRKTFVRLLGYDQSKLLHVSRMLLRFVGIWSEEGSILVLRIICTLSLSAYMFVGTTSFLYITDEDIISYGVGLSMPAYGFLSIIKTFWFFYNSKKIGWLIKELERITIENIFKEETHRQELIKAANVANVLSILLLFMMLFVCLFETVNCLIISSNDSRMIFNLHSYIDPTRYHLLALAFQYFYLIWPIAIYIITFNLLMSFTMLIVANLSILKGYFRSAPLNLSYFVHLHTDLVSLVKEMNEVLAPAIICELTTGSILTCLGAYMSVESITLKQKCISYAAFCCELAVPWFICHCGSILEEKSKALTNAVYSSRWIELKPKQRKEIIILMIATNRPMQIKLSYTHIINYTYYTSFIQLTYSFFTLLLSLKSN